jgi:hypothetical protein
MNLKAVQGCKRVPDGYEPLDANDNEANPGNIL